MQLTSLRRTANTRSLRRVSTGLMCGALIAGLVAPAHAQSSRSRDDLVAKLTGKRVHIDKATKRVREITADEARALIETVQNVTAAPDVSAVTTSQTGAGRMLPLDDHTGHIIIARPNEDGTVETRCVSSADEAVDFLLEDPLPLL